jgi:ureidoglycolate lyase
MKLVRYGEVGKEKPGVLDAQGAIRDLSGVVKDIDGHALSPEGLAKIRATDLNSLPKVSGSPRLGSPVAMPGKLVAIGLNYSDHAKESNMPIPSEPVMFMKSTSSICGPNDTVHLPKGSKKGDWEVELAFVMGKTARSVSEAEALDYVAGYLICNDVSEREWQLEHGSQWSKGKSFDTFAPLGPWVVTKDEIADPQNLSMWLEVNGKRMQTGNTNTMIFNLKKLVSYVSYVTTLHPGDVITTGTPPGVGMGIKPTSVFLKAGDTMRLGIDGLGEQKQDVKGG